MNYSVHHFKVLNDYLFYVIAANAANNEADTKIIESIFFQEERLKTIMY